MSCSIMEGKPVADCPSTVSIIGSGEFARSLATRLHATGINVVVGSRVPSKRQNVPDDDIFAKVKITTIPVCVAASDVLVVALHPEHHASLKSLEQVMAGKILIDCSNSERGNTTSNAEKLAALFPRSHVVKAFNTVSAFALLQAYHNRPTYVCGDDDYARGVVMKLASRIGFSPVDVGNLSEASTVEESNRKLLPGWGWPTSVTLIIFVLWAIYIICRYYIMTHHTYTWERIPTNIMNKIAGVVALTLLALSFIPGSIAAFKQLATGTKHRRFHKSLDRWLKMRKQLGLYALVFGSIHTIMSLALLGPGYFRSWYHTSSVTIPGNNTQDIKFDIDSRMNWRGEACTLFGCCAEFTMILLGITSINSIASSLNWKEWRFLQSYMGLVCLFFATLHVTTKGAYSWVNQTWKEILPGVAFLSCLLPWFALGMRMLLFMPCFYTRLNKIRRGWERGTDDSVTIVVDEPIANRKQKGRENGAFENNDKNNININAALEDDNNNTFDNTNF